VSGTAYSDLKAAWHLDDIHRMREGHQIVPKQVQLILSDLCNHDCHFCSYRMSNGFSSEQFVVVENGKVNRNPKRMIPTEKAREILDDCAALGVRAIQFTGGGEPTVHPDHLDLFGHALARGLECGLVSNGIILRDGWEAVLPRFKWIRISVDAGSPEEYARVRRVSESQYHKALTHIAQLAGEIKRQGTDCLLGVGYVITRENWADLYDGVERIKETGAAYVRLSAMFSTDGESYYDGLHAPIRDEIARVRSLEDDSFKVVNLFGDRIADLRQHAPDYDFCGYQQFNCYVGGNLKVYRCCTTAYTRHGEVGDLSNQSFREWFYSHGKRLAYADFNARSCHTCQFNSKNRTINYMLSGEPVHVNFV
jgi:MoaA/NifB/PqqE/SkfB family radical SAM enzyme